MADPNSPATERDRSQDEYLLRLLAVFHYVVGGLVALFALVPIVQLVFVLVFLFAPHLVENGQEPPPAFVGWFLVAFFSVFILLGLALAALVLAAGRSLARRRNHLFCLVVAGVECLFMPLGTVLGVLTIVLLMKDSVKDLFAAQDRARLGASAAPPR